MSSGPETNNLGSVTAPTVGLNPPTPLGGLTPEMNSVLNRLVNRREPAEVKTSRSLGDNNIDQLVMAINMIFGSGVGVMPQNDMMAQQPNPMQDILTQMFYAQ